MTLPKSEYGYLAAAKEMFWPLLICAAVFVGSIALGALWPTSDKWDGATLIKICRDGTPILRDKNGLVWARRNGWVAYRVEDEKSVCSQ